MKRKVLFLSIGLALLMGATAAIWLAPETRVPIVRKAAPPVNKRIYVLPLGSGCTQAFIRETQAQIRKFIPGVEVRSKVALPAQAYYKPRGRYRADTLIHWMGRMAKTDEVILGITTVDISASKDSFADFGLMGLGFRPGNAAVASNHRLRNKSAFWKVAIHELGHTVGLPHCTVKSCFMRDADGGNPTAEETAFCPNCAAVLRRNGWKL
jgi:archaemetzincin